MKAFSGKACRAAVVTIFACIGALAPAMAESAPDKARAQQADEKQIIASFKHLPLTEEKARAAVDTFLKLRKKYPPETFKVKVPGPVGVAAAIEASPRAAEVLADVKAAGFQDVQDWAFTFASLAMAIAHLRQGGELDASLKKLEEAKMPEEMKARIRAMLLGMRPPKENVEVAKKLLADPEMKARIDSIASLN